MREQRTQLGEELAALEARVEAVEQSSGAGGLFEGPATSTGCSMGLDTRMRGGRPYRAFEIAGERRSAFPAIVTLTLPPFEDLNWDAEVFFFFQEWELPFGLLGNEGFLDKWVVSFDRSANHFVVESPPDFQRRLPGDPFEDFQRFYPDEWAPPA